MLWSIGSGQNKVSTDHIASSGVEFIEVTWFLKLTADQRETMR